MFKRVLLPLILLAVGLWLAGCASMAINQGDEKLKEKHYYEAAREYLTALSYEPGNKEAQAKLSQIALPAYQEKLTMAQDYDKLGNQELALSNYEELSSLLDGLNKFITVNFTVTDPRPRILELRNSLAESHYAEGEKAFAAEDYPTAIHRYDRALHYVRPYKDGMDKMAESYYRMGQRMEREKNYRQAAENFENANRTIFSYKDARRLASINKSLADELDARRHYTNALEQANYERYKEAVKELKAALTFVPHYKNAEELIEKYTRKITEAEAEEHYEKGVEHMAKENYAEAKKELEQVIALVPDYRDAKELAKRAQQKLEFNEAQDHYEKGLKHAADGDYRKATDEFEKVLKIMPTYKEAKSLAEKYKALAEEKEAKEKAAKEQKEKEDKEKEKPKEGK